jgi:hypothetical protein
MTLLSDNTQRAKNSLIAFYILAFCQALLMLSSFLQYLVLKKVENGNYTQEELEQNDLRHQIIAFTNIAVFIVCIVLFIMWFRRAYFNLHQTNKVSTEFTEGWAAGAWFVPFLNLVRPYYIMKEIWNKTQYATNNLLTHKPSTIIGWWWALWLIFNLGNNILSKIFKGSNLQDLMNDTLSTIFMGVVEMAALILLIIIIKQVSVFEQNLQLSLLNKSENQLESEDKLNFIV